MLQRFILRTPILYNKNIKITINFEVYMSKEWLKTVNMTVEESADLEMWCEYIGYERYEKIYNLVYRANDSGCVNYKELRAIAKYDFSLSDILHSMMKLVDLRFRSYFNQSIWAY